MIEELFKKEDLENQNIGQDEFNKRLDAYIHHYHDISDVKMIINVIKLFKRCINARNSLNKKSSVIYLYTCAPKNTIFPTKVDSNNKLLADIAIGDTKNEELYKNRQFASTFETGLHGNALLNMKDNNFGGNVEGFLLHIIEKMIESSSDINKIKETTKSIIEKDIGLFCDFACRLTNETSKTFKLSVFETKGYYYEGDRANLMITTDEYLNDEKVYKNYPFTDKKTMKEFNKYYINFKPGDVIIFDLIKKEIRK